MPLDSASYSNPGTAVVRVGARSDFGRLSRHAKKVQLRTRLSPRTRPEAKVQRVYD